ncbi:MAG: hypothetical protein IKE01_01980 [Clostridia bacterium]|nr:hypothetical protein [Clostridia bacterium]
MSKKTMVVTMVCILLAIALTAVLTLLDTDLVSQFGPVVAAAFYAAFSLNVACIPWLTYMHYEE